MLYAVPNNEEVVRWNSKYLYCEIVDACLNLTCIWNLFKISYLVSDDMFEFFLLKCCCHNAY